jgi:hypothetical protein
VTADEFIASVAGFDKLGPSVQTDLLALYLLEHSGASSVGPATIESLRTALRMADHGRLSAYLSESTKKRGGKPARYVKVRGGYVLERAYAAEIKRNYLGRPAAKHLATSLRGTLSAISDAAVRSYLEEAVAAFEHGHMRAALILTWCVAYGILRDWLFRNHLAALNGVFGRWKKPFYIAKLDDFQELTEAVVVDNARTAGIVSKEQHKTLRQLLDQRNSYAHPTTKPITPSIVEAYIDTVIREVLPAYG